jgi:hypothetical protein
MLRSAFVCAAIAALTFTFSPGVAQAQGRKPASPPAQTAITIGGKTITIKYSAPSMRGRKIFGPSGLVSHDPIYPVWRAGANAATSLHTDADLNIGGLHVPAGDYTLFVNVADPDQWELIVSGQTGEWGLAYKKDKDLGRAKMEMSKPSAPIETFKITLSSGGGDKGTLQMEWADHSASVAFTVK